jgi:hypothetical protein
MPTSLSIAFFILGAILIVLGFSKGNFEVFGAKVGATISNSFLRFISVMLGIIFVVASCSPSLSDNLTTESSSLSSSNLASNAHNLFDETEITNNILDPVSETAEGYPVVKTDNGNGARLSVNLANIPSDIDKSKYKLVAFARINDNPEWSSQGMKDLSESPSPFELTLWHDPAGDQKLYEAITIISSTFNDNERKVYTEYEVRSFEQKRSDTLTFYRDDSQ